MQSHKQISDLITANAVQGRTTVHRVKIAPELAKIILENFSRNNKNLSSPVQV